MHYAERMRMQSVCISGHRPERFASDREKMMVMSLLYQELFCAAEEGFTVFYIGMARGVDLWAGEFLHNIRRSFPLIRIIGVYPYPEFNQELEGEWLYRARLVRHYADQIVSASPAYHKGCYAVRNQYMVNHSARLIAVSAELRSGTGQTIRMAQRAGIETRILSFREARRQKSSACPFIVFE